MKIHSAVAISTTLCIAQQNLSIGVNVVSKGSPSRILRVLLISLGITIRPRSSTLLTMPVAFVYLSHFTDVGIRIPTGASALGMTQKYDSRSGYRKPLSLRASAHTGVAIRSPTIILQITLLVSVKGRRLYRKIYFFNSV